MPKKPAGGSFGVFLNENRAKIVASLPAGHKITDVSKAAGAQFKLLSEEAKKKYEATYQKKKADYEKAMKEYKAAQPNDNDADEDEDDDDEEEEGEESSPQKAKPKAPAQKRAAVDKETGSAKRSRSAAVKSGA